MPRKPKHPCGHPGCAELVEAGERYCEKHKAEEARSYERYRRSPETKKRYGRAWKRIRDRYIAQHPLCEQCFLEGKSVLAEEVHHILPLADGGDHSEKNLQALCKACHSRIHIKDKRPGGKGR